MTPDLPRDAGDAVALGARVDELTAVVAALGRVLERGTTPPPGTRPDRLTEQQMMEALDAVAVDLDNLRALLTTLRERADVAEGDLASARAAAERAGQDSEARRLSAAEWEQEATRLAAHRDEVVAELLAVQGSRWTNIGRSLRVMRGR
jgi:hypothetical protein